MKIAGATGLRWTRGEAGKRVAVWRASKAAVRLGYPLKNQRLWCGEGEPTTGEADAIANNCARLRREMKDWIRGEKTGRPSAGRRGKVYFISSATLIKIGFAVDVKARLARLNTGSADQLILIGALNATQDRERAIHDQFAAMRRKGEWFEPTGRLAEFLNMQFGWRPSA